MIQRTPTRIEAHLVEDRPSWQQLLSESITCPEELLARLNLSPERWLQGARAGHQLFPVRVPEPFLARMRKGDPNDPLLRQVLPVSHEALRVPGFVRDPLEEDGAIQTTGLIRKYRSRALLMVTGQCAVNCRYCFRRHFPYEDQRLSPRDRQHIVETLAASPEINEVILSGGDPLAVNDRLLAQWANELGAISHLKRLRLHTRLPVVIPERVCESLLAWLKKTRLQVVMVLHINHPHEVDSATRAALEQLRDAGVTLLNQSVILRGVNDSTEVLEALSETLFDAGVLPYYLHAFDPVEGAHHYDVSDDEARGLVRDLLSRLPGFLVPKLVREVPGRDGKTPLNLFS
ncbi:EF-P beta-lysylation protein EpmB [Marinobacter alexandrii]|jgi:EF-P beta-lysylation protein EpmB|uniref:EF-P beta-lysylation protein EpmB n=1 Tax=Marinobacter alexandrii TaxID=2570351 RepID=UPI001109AA6A|nr:EF-P beta-lysylation protein EpmB [Marinobacter alexandrii]MCK2151032.1 EF-P beta-lysylation protein EpmB [Marinobacter alexandrii]